MNGCPVLYPIGRKRLVWDVYLSLLLLVVSITTPWNIAFFDDPMIDNIAFDLLVDASFLTDLIINFNTAFYKYTNERSQLVTSRSQIAKNYIKGWFWIDLISCLPFDYVTKYSANNLGKILRVSKLHKLFKLLRIPRLLKLCSMK